jgi:hypothetical protein
MTNRVLGLFLIFIGAMLLISRIPITGNEHGTEAFYVVLGIITILVGAISNIVLGDD